MEGTEERMGKVIAGEGCNRRPLHGKDHGKELAFYSKEDACRT